MSDAQETARLALMEDQGEEDNGHRTRSDENRDAPAQDMAWNFHDLQYGYCRGVPAL